MLTASMRPAARFLAALLFVLVSVLVAREAPTSYGDAAKVDTPVVRVPMMKTSPTIDGLMSPGEWDDAAGISGFWYDYAQSDFRYLAPLQTQLQVYVAYDKDNLYYCFTSPVYPKNSWLKARGRFPDVLSHPLYGTLWDDHTELEIRPHDDLSKGFQLGLFRFDVNPINNRVDWFWSQRGGHDLKWTPGAKIRSSVTGARWIIEYAIPFKSFVYGAYGETDKEDQPYIQIPPPDGTIYRTWLVRGIGGNGIYFNAYDQHCWNTTKTQLVFDANAPSFQINELGPIMDDIIDVHLTVKNHTNKSQTVQLGFFVENAGGTIYSSYDSPKLKDGLLELVPGEQKRINLKKHFPGITQEDNVLWFDVRAAGQPAKQLYLSRLIRFHSMEGGVVKDRKMVVPPGAEDPVVAVTAVPFKKRRLDAIAELRPPRKDFDFRPHFSSYTKKVSAVVDRGIHGASEDVQRAIEARLSVFTADAEEQLIKEASTEFKGDFACFLVDLPELVNGEQYMLSLLLFDDNKRIVGERNPEPFQYRHAEWMGNKIGLNDVVWEPFEPMQLTDSGFTTLKHEFVVGKSGLPEQIIIKPDVRELPLELRGQAPAAEGALQEIGRGKQLRRPLQLAVVIDGKRQLATVTKPAELVRQWKSELEYVSQLQVGPLTVDLTTRYDCDGSMHCSLDYASDPPVEIESFELSMQPAGTIDLMLSETGHGSMAAADRWEIGIPDKEGVVWDSTLTSMELFFNNFVPYFWYGSGDRGWTWYCDFDKGFALNRDGSMMDLRRAADGAITWRVQFVNHPTTIKDKRHVDFAILTHPAKPKPKDYRSTAWHYFGGKGWATGYAIEPIVLPEAYLKKRWHQASGAPKDMPWEKAAEYRPDNPPWHRYGQWRNVGVCAELDQTWADKATYYFEQHIRIGRRVGWWMDEYFPVGFGRSDNVAAGNAYFRDPKEVGEKELPWHSGFLTTHMRNHYKRLARVFETNNVPQRQHTWSNNAASMLEPFIYNSLLVEECGAGHRSREIDVITQFPNTLYRYLAKTYTGLVTTVCADATFVQAGDEKRPDRNHFARALLNNIGVSPTGPHGIIHHKEQGVRLLRELTAFGFFDDAGFEMLPYWRNQRIVGVGAEPAAESRVYVTVYRRPLDDGTGYKAIFVVVNESDDIVELPLIIRDPKRIFGGANNLTAGCVRAGTELPKELAGWWQAAAADGAQQVVLKDLESGTLVARDEAKTDRYGPLFVPYHDFRVLYGEFRRKK